MRLSLGPLRVTIKYTYPRGSTTVYQRAVPTDLRDRYPGATVKQVLQTTDPVQVARLVSALNQRLEAEWEALRAAPESSPKSLKAHADAYLKGWGLAPNSPSNDPQAIALLHDHIDSKRMHHAGGDEEVYQDADPAEYLTAVEREAGRRLHGLTSDTLSDALEQYLKVHPQKEDAKFVRYQRLAFDSLLTICGDREVKTFMRADARAYMETALQSVKTTTVRRRMNVYSAVFASYFNENNVQRPNPFADLPIPKEGHDSKPRVPFTHSELCHLEGLCRRLDDPRRWLLAMLLGTGARLAEVAGALIEDIKLDAPVPHALLQVHPWRNIKGARWVRGKKDRVVPLLGPALWAAKRVCETATEGQRFAFPQYTNEKTCAAGSASGALNAWMRGASLEHTCHELRHTVIDLLRDVQCPKDVTTAITGHGKKDTNDGYGDGYSLTIKAQWLGAALVNAGVPA